MYSTLTDVAPTDAPFSVSIRTYHVLSGAINGLHTVLATPQNAVKTNALDKATLKAPLPEVSVFTDTVRVLSSIRLLKPDKSLFNTQT